MFPGTSDDSFLGQEWTEQTAGNIPADRRFLQSAGAFTLLPGAVKTVFGDTNKDTIHFHFNTAARDALSDFVFKYDFSRIKSNGILEFWSGKKIKAIYYIDNPIGQLNLIGLFPGKYNFKFIADEDNNKRHGCYTPGRLLFCLGGNTRYGRNSSRCAIVATRTFFNSRW